MIELLRPIAPTGSSIKTRSLSAMVEEVTVEADSMEDLALFQPRALNALYRAGFRVFDSSWRCLGDGQKILSFHVSKKAEVCTR